MTVFKVKAATCFGEDALKALEDIEAQSVLIVCDKFLNDNGTVPRIAHRLLKAKKVTIFDGPVPDPTTAVVGSGVKFIAASRPDVIIGIGGGSAIDTAKAMIYFAVQGGIIEKPYFIAIPTTCGTGSEMTALAVIRDADTQIKHVLVDDKLMAADMAILETSLVLTVPAGITANTGMDVITHAVEAYVAKGANVYSDALAEKAMELVLSSLLACYEDGRNAAARERMHEASNLAGIAFNTAGLGVNHSMAHQLGSMYHLPHGLACSFFLEAVIDYNAADPAVQAKYARLAVKLGLANASTSDAQAVLILKNVIRALKGAMHVPTRIRDIKNAPAQEAYTKACCVMAQNAMQDFCLGGNPVAVSQEAVASLYAGLY